MAYTLIEDIHEEAGNLIIPYSKYRLHNGLTVIIHIDNTSPLVHVDVSYHVGSGREEIGKSGFAHFFEHMMFEGSKHVANNLHFKYISEAGGTMNGSTNRDRTNYYETLPKNQLELALWLESDSMGFLLDAVTQEGFENQRSVIKNEKSQRYENQPYGMLGQITQENFYPENHPYSWTTIGYTEDLDRVTINDLKEFFATWYGPNNAVLTIGGDVDVEETIKMVDQYFGSIPTGPEVNKSVFEPFKIDQTRYVSFQDKVRFPMLQITLPTVPVYHPHEAALDILADILGNGKNSLLYKAFVKTRKAVQVYASNYCYEGSGEFRIGLFAYPNQSLAALEKEVYEILQQFATQGIDAAEVERTRAKYYSQILYSLESVKNKVSRLSAYHLFAPATNFAQQDIARYRNLGTAEVMDAFEQYIYNKPSVNISFYDEAHKELLPAPDNHHFERKGLERIRHAVGEVAQPLIKDTFNRADKPAAGAVPVVQVPHMYQKNFVNGLQLMGSSNHKSPTVAITLSFKAGSITDPAGQAGRATFYSRMFTESVGSLSAEDISNQLEMLGSSISANAGKENFNINIRSLRENLSPTLVLLKELMNRNGFDEEELERNRFEHKEFLAYQKDEVDVLANRTFYESLYGKNHLLGRSTSGAIDDTDNLTAETLLQFKAAYLNPDNCLLVASGAIAEEELLHELDFLTTQWKGNKTLLPQVAEPQFATGGTIIVRHKENAPQSEIRIGYPAMPYDATGLFYRAGIMNYALGSAFNSRINLNLREDKGYTYGARSYFQGGRYNGPFIAAAAVAANVTADAVKEFLFELKNYRDQGIQPDELAFTKSSLLNRDALKYETNSQINQFMLKMLEFGLVKDYVEEQKRILANIALEEVNQIANKWLPVENMVVVVAGDKNTIVPPLQQLNFGPLVIIDESVTV
ncbi:insulinase family protein [bacterium]|nr:insulinase family protein [bacterium]